MKLLLGLLAIPALMLVRGWAVATLWAWFVVPLGVKPIGLAWGYGLVCLGSLVSDTIGVAKDYKVDGQGAGAATAVQLLLPLLVVLFAWFAKLAMP